MPTPFFVTTLSMLSEIIHFPKKEIHRLCDKQKGLKKLMLLFPD